MASSVANSERVAFDPYALPPEAIEEPPKSLWKALRKIGPGIILAGTIVGSGELILTQTPMNNIALNFHETPAQIQTPNPNPHPNPNSKPYPNPNQNTNPKP